MRDKLLSPAAHRSRMIHCSRSLDQLIHISLRSFGCFLPLVLLGSLELPDAPESSYVFGWCIQSQVFSIIARAHHPNFHQLMDIFLGHGLDFILVLIQAPSNTNHKCKNVYSWMHKKYNNHTEILAKQKKYSYNSWDIYIYY